MFGPCSNPSINEESFTGHQMSKWKHDAVQQLFPPGVGWGVGWGVIVSTHLKFQSKVYGYLINVCKKMFSPNNNCARQIRTEGVSGLTCYVIGTYLNWFYL